MGHAPYTYEETVKAANQAFKEGRLGFQKLERAQLGCLYKYPDGGCCGLGAIHPTDQNGGVHLVFDQTGIFEEDISGRVIPQLYHFQTYHDVLTIEVKHGDKSIKEAEAEWRKKFIT